jgi:hypothetical protein
MLNSKDVFLIIFLVFLLKLARYFSQSVSMKLTANQLLKKFKRKYSLSFFPLMCSKIVIPFHYGSKFPNIREDFILFILIFGPAWPYRRMNDALIAITNIIYT